MRSTRERIGQETVSRRSALPTYDAVMSLFETVEGAVRTWTLYVSAGVEGIAGVIVTIGVLEATIRAVRAFARSSRLESADTLVLRLRLGRWLAISLEFLLAADILRTAVAPTWNDIGQLAAIAAIRTLLNYFLEREIEGEERQARASPLADADGAVGRGATASE